MNCSVVNISDLAIARDHDFSENKFRSWNFAGEQFQALKTSLNCIQYMSSRSTCRGPWLMLFDTKLCCWLGMQTTLFHLGKQQGR